MLTVVRAGWSTTVQDDGRGGLAALGVPRSGALDAARHRLVNRLVGNDPLAAVLETAGSLVVRAERAVVVATSDELTARSVGPGELVDVTPATNDLWGYLAVRGGIAVEPVLGSRSRDTLAGLGPPPIEDGTRLAVGPDPGTELTVDQAPPRPRPEIVEIWPGPRVDWFADGTLEQLATTNWTVSADVSRVGARLAGPPLRRRHDGELPSEGLVLGAIQVPPDGVPVVMLADHPTTGGYPVVAIVDPAAVATVAQSRPGATLRFRLHRIAF